MKVAIVGPSLSDIGGVANYYNAVYPMLSNDSVRAEYFEVGKTRANGRVFHIVGDQFRFWRMLRSKNPDIVHLNPSLDFKSFFRDGLFVFIAKMLHRPVIVFFRGWHKPFEAAVTEYFRYFFTWTYAKADLFVVLGQEFSTVLRQWGVTAPVLVGTTAVDERLLKDFSIDRKWSRAYDDDVVRLLYLARLERGKGVLELVEGVSGLLENGKRVSLTIAGDGPLLEEVRALIRQLGPHQGSVQLVGYVRDREKATTFESHDIYCFPTQYGEGMPNSVLEAMAFGLPVITCSVGGIADFFEDGKMGVLLPNVDRDSIGDAISLICSDAARIEQISRFNYEFARRHFLSSIAAEFLRKCYRDLDY